MTARFLRELCHSCDGVGIHLDEDLWHACEFCDGTGWVWIVGGPLFDARGGTLADRNPGEIVRVGPSETRVRIAWHQPKRERKVKPLTTYVRIVDDFDDFEADPIPVPSTLGVHAVIVPHADEEPNAPDDVVDPFVKAQQDRGDLL